MYFETDFFVRVVRNQNQGYVSRKCIPLKIFEHTLYLHIFLITMHEIDTAAEVYLESFQTLWLRFLRK